MKFCDSGSVAFNDALGGFGWPIGRIGIVWGKPSSGKTTLLYHTIAHFQKLCRNCYRPFETMMGPDGPVRVCDCVKTGVYKPVYDIDVVDPDRKAVVKKVQHDIFVGESEEQFQARLKSYDTKGNSYEEVMCMWVDAEGSFETPWAMACGVDCSRLLFGEYESGEQAFDVTTDLMRLGVFDVLVLDSIASMVPQAEIEASAVDAQVAVGARLTNRGIRSWVGTQAEIGLITGKRPTVFLVNQPREKINATGYGGASTSLPHGVFQRFAATVEVKCHSEGFKFEEIKIGNEKEKSTIPISIGIGIQVPKNKIASPRRKALLTLQFQPSKASKAGEINEYGYIWRVATGFDLVQHYEKGPRKGWLVLPPPEVEGEPEVSAEAHGHEWRFKTQKLAQQYVLDNPAFWQKLRMAVADKLRRQRFEKGKGFGE